MLQLSFIDHRPPPPRCHDYLVSTKLEAILQVGVADPRNNLIINKDEALYQLDHVAVITRSVA